MEIIFDWNTHEINTVPHTLRTQEAYGVLYFFAPVSRLLNSTDPLECSCYKVFASVIMNGSAECDEKASVNAKP